MTRLTESQMATIASQAWFGYNAAYTARRLGLPLATVKAYRVSPKCIARLSRIAVYYAQKAKQGDAS
jgi:DNA-directed RNA polymerase specialized sigma24 family protein